MSIQTLPEFIAELGDSKAARLFGVTERAVQSWRRRERLPRPAMAARIIEAAAGRVSMAGIYNLPDAAPAAPAEKVA